VSARLIIIGGPLQGEMFPLTATGLTIGRESGNDVVVKDRSLSRRHCRLRAESGSFKICDLGSRNGTFLNGIPVKEHTLRDRDEISLGSSVLLFRVDTERRAEQSAVEVQEHDQETIEETTVLRREHALYLNPDKISAALPQEDRVARNLNLLLKIASRISGIRDCESLAWQLLGLTFDAIPAERGAVLLLDNDSDEFSAAAAWNRASGPAHPVQVNGALVRQVLRERIAVLQPEVAADMVEGLRNDAAHPQRSILSVPLAVAGEKVMGAFYFDAESSRYRFDEHDLQLAVGIAGIASLALENARHIERLQDENHRLNAELHLQHNMVGQSPSMQQVFRFIARVAGSESTVLLQGESGTGKELVARGIHRNSTRATGPYVAINCAALTETLLESELFGHEKGAFTGAHAMKKGKVEVAGGGCLFLDEVGELAPGLQGKLLRVLQEREFERVGGTHTIKTDFRLIAATNKNLEEAVQRGAFRPDLFYRLNVVTLTMPPLRERHEDILLLADYFINQLSKKCKTQPRPLSAAARECLLHYSWPGNVRELENAIERALVLGSADSILPEDLPDALLESRSGEQAEGEYHVAVKDAKKRLILQALERSRGSCTEAAKLLGLHPNYLHRLIRNLGIPPEAKSVKGRA